MSEEVDRARELPAGLVAAGASPTFTQDSVPDAIQREHALASGRWGLLRVLEGSLIFIDLATQTEHAVHASDQVVIAPQAPHMLRLVGPVSCKIDFFREA